MNIDSKMQQTNIDRLVEKLDYLVSNTTLVEKKINRKKRRKKPRKRTQSKQRSAIGELSHNEEQIEEISEDDDEVEEDNDDDSNKNTNIY